MAPTRLTNIIIQLISSITTDCIELGNTISRTSLVLNEFVREVRDARADLDNVSRELHSLQGVLNLLKDDAGALPSRVAAQTPAVLEHCNRVVTELDGCLLSLVDSGLSRPEKRMQWLDEGRLKIAELCMSLEAHRFTMGLALDLVGVTSGRPWHDIQDEGIYEKLENEEAKVGVQSEAARILEEMAAIKAKMPDEFGYDGENFSLQAYWVALKLYATSLTNGHETEDAAYLGSKPMFDVYIGDTHDSAIEVTTDESASLKSLDRVSTKSPADEYLQEVTELMDEMLQEPSRPPTPPPKDIKRLLNMRKGAVSPFEGQPEDAFGSITEITSGGSAMRSESSLSRTKSTRMGRLFGHWKSVPSDASSASEHTLAESLRPSTPIVRASLVRRSSRRLSTSIRRLPLWNTELEEPEVPSSESNAVFGVSIQKSMAVAKSTARTHHKGSGSSRREFPLCLHKCVAFLQKEGLEAPDIFAEPGDSYRVQKLKEAFSNPPTYGEDVSWDNFGVYDAADIILLFLSQLPRPLVPDSLARRWVALSRQATMSGSHGKYIDQCMDFWEDALGGMKGPARSLFKLLLNLWAEVADAAEMNDMTAERLAGVLMKPLMHTVSEKNRTDYMLGLAFLIRKRSEYTLMLKEGRPSRAAF